MYIQNVKHIKPTFNLPNQTPPHKVIEFQEPTSANNYTWYRLYDDRWVEQGGQANSKTVSLPITMSDTNYETIINTLYNNGGSAAYFDLGYISSKTTTGFTKAGNATVFNWVVYGTSARDATQQIMCIKY